MTSFKIDQPGYSLQYTQNGNSSALAIAIAEAAANASAASAAGAANTNQGLFNNFDQLNNVSGQSAQQQFNPMNFFMQFIQMIMQMLFKNLGLGNNQQDQAQQQNQNNAAAGAGAGATGTDAAAAAAAAGKAKGADTATIGTDKAKGAGAGAAASAAASASASGKDFSQMSNDELQAYWNEHKDSASGDEIHRRAKTSDSKTSSGETLHDPYEVTIDGEKYLFVKDENQNGKVDSEKEILGINDSKDDLFQGMKELDKNQDGKVDKSEMDAANVKLAKVAADGKVDLNQTKDINSVDINSFLKSDKFKGAGEAGVFNVNLADGNTVQGKEIFEELEQILKYTFAKV